MVPKAETYRPHIRGRAAQDLLMRVDAIAMHGKLPLDELSVMLRFGIFRVLSVTAETDDLRKKAFHMAVGSCVSGICLEDRNEKLLPPFRAIEEAVTTSFANNGRPKYSLSSERVSFDEVEHAFPIE